jgi:hypothetical protein
VTKSPNLSAHLELKSNHIGQNYSLKPLKAKASPHSSTLVDQVKELQLNPPQRSLKLQKLKLRKNNQRKRNNSQKYKNKNKEVWEDSLIDSYLNSLWILSYSSKGTYKSLATLILIRAKFNKCEVTTNY